MTGRAPFLFLAVLLAALVIPVASGETTSIRLAGWNMESGESSNAILKLQLAAKRGVDIWSGEPGRPDRIRGGR